MKTKDEKKQEKSIIYKEIISPDNFINKDGNKEYVVEGIGSSLSCIMKINRYEDKISNMVIDIIFPEGMSYIPESFVIGIYKEKDLKWLRSKDFIKIKKDKITLNIGDTNSCYYLFYKLKVCEIKKTYLDKTIINYNNITDNLSLIIKYKLNSGVLNANKSVVLEDLDDNKNKRINYNMEFKSYGYFNENYIFFSEKLDNNIKILSVDVPDNFTYKIEDDNTITFFNDKGDINYGDHFNVTIIANVDNMFIEENTNDINKSKLDKNINNKSNILLSEDLFIEDNSNIIIQVVNNSEGVIN